MSQAQTPQSSYTGPIVVDPITRIEGHLRIEVEVENGRVKDARSAATLFRGLEMILKGRDPRDAQHFTQRTCGVCTYTHALASTRALEDAIGVEIPRNATAIRNLVLGMQYLHDHVVHFYHLHALDFVDVTAALKADPVKAAQLNASISGKPLSAETLKTVQTKVRTLVDSGQLGPFTNAYFLDKAKQMAALGADMVTIKDMSGLIQPSRIAELIPLFKQNLSIPVDFHTHCTPGYGLGAVLMAIIKGVDIVDTNIWNFAGGTGAPAIELVYIFCKKLGVELDVNMEAVAKINKELYGIRKELEAVDASKQFPNPFNPLTDQLPAEIDKEFDKAIEAAKANNEEALLNACHAIEAYFNFPKPNELVKKAEVPGGMYSNMVAQLKQLNSMDILEKAMELIPTVRLAAGLPPLVTPTSQIVGAQAVICLLGIIV